MKTLKKTLCLVLAVVMVVGVLVLPAGAADAETNVVTEQETALIKVLEGLKILQGKDDKLPHFEDDVNREEAAAFVARMLVSDAVAAAWPTDDLTFTDVAKTSWSAPYIAYCVSEGIIEGKTPETFDPKGKLNSYDLAKMVLVAIGANNAEDFNGGNYTSKVHKAAMEAGILENVDISNSNMKRGEVAQLVLNALTAEHSGTEYKYVVTDPATGEVLYDGTNYERAQIVASSKNVEAVIVPLTLGYTVFGLEQPTTQAIDDWGRPGTVYSWNGGKIVIPFKAVADYTTAIDECDIMHDIEDDGYNDGPVATYWLDGVKQDLSEVTVFENVLEQGDNNIKGLNVGYTTGDQGVKTEVYFVENSYYVVQIYTWLAKVTEEVDQGTDDNGHPYPRYITIEVYVGEEYEGAKENTEDGYWYVSDTQVNSTYVKGQYLLVNNCAGKWVIDSEAEVLKDEIPETENVNYYLHNGEELDNPTIFGDKMGNVIGQVDNLTNANYTVIEAMAWMHTTLKGGEAKALLWINGELTDEVTIATINGTPVTNTEVAKLLFADLTFGGKAAVEAEDEPAGAADEADPSESEETSEAIPDTDYMIADHWENNTAYYGHIFAYTVNEDGSYNLFTTTHAQEETLKIGNLLDSAPNTYVGKIVKGQVNIELGTDEDGKAILSRGTDETVYLISDGKGSYTSVTGKDNISDKTGDICVATDDNGFAILVVVTEKPAEPQKPAEDTGTPTVVYVTNVTPSGTSANSKKHIVFVLGSDKGTTVVDADGVWTSEAVTETGLYVMNIRANGTIASIGGKIIGDFQAQTTETAVTSKTKTWVVNTMATAPVTGNALYTYPTNWNGNLSAPAIPDDTKDIEKDKLNFSVTNAKYFVVTKSGDSITAVTPESLRAGTAKDVDKNSVVIVVYGEKNQASYVYVVKGAEVAGETTGSATLKVDDQLKNQYYDLGIASKVEGTTITFTWSAKELNEKLKDADYADIWGELEAEVDGKNYLFVGVHFDGVGEGATYNNGGDDQTVAAEDLCSKGSLHLYFGITGAKTGDKYSSKAPDTQSYDVTVNGTVYTVVLNILA